jgi:hypothetical protein
MAMRLTCELKNQLHDCVVWLDPQERINVRKVEPRYTELLVPGVADLMS